MTNNHDPLDPPAPLGTPLAQHAFGRIFIIDWYLIWTLFLVLLLFTMKTDFEMSIIYYSTPQPIKLGRTVANNA